MESEKIILIVFWGIVLILWFMNIWGGWAESEYERIGEESLAWYWLKVFKISINRENCVRFIKGISWFGIIVVSALSLIIISS